ncbi:MAG: FAD-binding oxidoreductase [Gemmataceae bacterium]|nr:FAD-binding oxidoreductase [Gemmataceae bacterium]
MDQSSLTIDEFGPLPVRRPASAAELGEVVRAAAAEGQGVYPVGGRTTLDVGVPPTRPGVAVDTTALDQVVDYPARDMTITVGAGIAVARLREVLAREGQWLPVDVPDPDRATLGGAVALNKSGPRRLGYGTLRDYVIGIKFVTDEGKEVSAGGRVVKNVAGYDLMKLQTGAVGTLGVVTQLTLKVRPKPEASALVTFGCDARHVPEVLDLLHASASRPVAVELLNPLAWAAAGGTPGPKPAWVVAAGFEGKAATVDWQMNTLLGELKAAPVRDAAEVRGPEADRLWRGLAGLQRRPESRWVWKAGVPPGRVAEVATALHPQLVQAHAQNGIVWVHAADGFEPDGPTDSRLTWLEQRVTAAGGNTVMTRCPAGWKKSLRVWGRPTADRDLMRQVKRALDPGDVFNPGRLFG